MAALETVGLTKRYGEVTAVEDLDLVVEEGEAFGFLGPNGAGKSTTIHMLLDFVRPTAGRATVLGHDVRERPVAAKRSIGVLPEDASMYDELTAREHLSATVRMKGVDDDPDALLSAVGIADAADRRVGTFSTGMRQRLRLAVALAGDPELLILDEPSAGLDPRGVQTMRDVLTDRVGDGATVFFSSHILGQVEAVCDRVGILHRGRLAAVDSIDGLRDRLGTPARVVFEIRGGVDETSLESLRRTLPGVELASVDGRRLTVSVAADATKMDVIQAVNERLDVDDVVVEEASLQSIFNEITDDEGADGSTTAEAEVSG